jgi:CNT family concentrative nucleoside transporter
VERYIGIIGLITILLIAFLMSNNKRRINLRTLIMGLALQWGIAILLIKWPAGNLAMQWFADKVSAFLNLSREGSGFLFGRLVDAQMMDTFGFQFAFTVLPTIIFFASFMSILYYLGIMQHIVEVFGWIMSRLMRTSGSESLSCSANVFLGQTEAPLLIRPFLNHCTLSELNAIMVGGFGTIAGAIMAGYIQMGVPPQHIIIASCMAAPASLMVAKIIFPEMEHSETAGDVKLPRLDVGRNLLDSAARGVTDGLQLALNVAAMLVAFITLIALLDKVLAIGDRLIDGGLLHGMLQENGEYAGWFPGSLKTIFGSIFSPLVYLMGVPKADVFQVGHLLGLKISVNEFVAYSKLAPMIKDGLISQKAAIMATYMLCGFANFASIGIQIGGIGALAPERRSDLAKLALKAMFGGALVSCMTATIAGLLLG